MKRRLFLGLSSLCLVVIGLSGCADVPSTAPDFPDFRTMTRVIHAAPDIADIEVIVQPTAGGDFTSLGTLSFQGNTAYLDIPAGNRLFALRSGGTIVDSTSLALESDGKLTLLLLPKAMPNDTRFKLFKERRIFDPVPATVGQVRFINAVANSAGFDVANVTDTTVVAQALAFGKNTGYQSFESGTFTFAVTASGSEDVLGTVEISLSGGQRHTVVILGDQANVAVKAFQDDPL